MNKYEIIGVIDEGAYGVVMKAQNNITKQMVAIKRFKDSDEDQTVYKNIQREIQMLKAFKSQYVVELKEAFRKKGKVYLIFQYIDRNLLNVIEEHEDGVPKKLICQLIYKLVRAVHYLHSNNALHRDIKPENILVSLEPELRLRICDFGFTRILSMSKMTDYVATRWYRSPQLLVGQQYGKEVDMWAIGCIMGEMLDGQPMFPGQNQLDQIYLIKKMFGSLAIGQEGILKNGKRFHGIKFPEVKIRQPLEMRYLNKIQKTQLSFLKACLKVDPNQRLTAYEALRHPYLKEHSMKQQFLREQTELLQNRKKSYPEISTSAKHSSDDKINTFSGKKFSLQAMFSKQLGKHQIMDSHFSPRKLVEASTSSLTKRQTLSILPKLPNGERSVSIPRGHLKGSSVQLKISKIKTIYNNFPVKLRQSKQKHAKKGR